MGDGEGLQGSTPRHDRIAQLLSKACALQVHLYSLLRFFECSLFVSFTTYYTPPLIGGEVSDAFV